MAEVQQEYPPPYSPDYNPIEKSFKQLKSWMKRNVAEQDMFDNFYYLLDWFWICGYRPKGWADVQGNPETVENEDNF
ncbi:hypothetical protein BU25DRAFT_457864 [Macroventuria anomochaeta]|uniref:Uncharacterized protein n=1 Tax=Macroventuria anomochaeta TaxID=301207 RepID=A0ACB6S2R5_9PLEO|nr:uncharacterized protein BU25DRAFT_457864 [Macroventuria anomochaeta]KAF2628565.1 hypothetical protein BU25DRAFT_457864 [Macroventuria anomochaeta]